MTPAALRLCLRRGGGGATAPHKNRPLRAVVSYSRSSSTFSSSYPRCPPRRWAWTSSSSQPPASPVPVARGGGVGGSLVVASTAAGDRYIRLALSVGVTAAAAAFGTHATEASAEGDEERPKGIELEAEWDDFMVRSIRPGEDDDDDDDEDDEDDEDEDEQEEKQEKEGEAPIENGIPQGPADETEDGDGDRVQKGEQGDGVDGIEGPESTAFVAPPSPSEGGGTRGSSKGPADEGEDVGPGYENDGVDNGSPTYEDLPEEDEPTSCTICLINRRGPCRLPWRKFERCMKDHGREEEDSKESSGRDGDGEGGGKGEASGEEEGGLAAKCDVLMLPWLDCIQSHRNTYTLITNSFYQEEYVDRLEDAIPPEDRISDDGENLGADAVDLSLWWQHAATEMAGIDEEIEKEMDEARAFLAQKREDEGAQQPPESADRGAADTTAVVSGVTDGPALPPLDDLSQEEKDASSEPILVAATATVRLRDSATGFPIDMAYVRDQAGDVLGFEQLSEEKELLRGNRGDAAERGEAVTAAQSPPETGKCNFHIQPGTTASVRIFAIYREEEKEEKEGSSENGSSGSKKKREERLRYGPAVSLADAAVNGDDDIAAVAENRTVAE